MTEAGGVGLVVLHADKKRDGSWILLLIFVGSADKKRVGSCCG